MDDSSDFPRETPRFWIALGIIFVTLVAVFVMAVVTSTSAHAQAKCDDISTVVDDLGEKYGETIIWSGKMPTPSGEVRAMLFQSPNNTWTMVAVQGVQACFMAAGKDATPAIETGKGV